MSIPLELFHYTKSCTAIKILLNGEIRFGFLGDTNDPKENKEWSLVQIPFHNSNSPYQIDHVANEIRSKEWKVTCFSKHRNKALRGYSAKVMKPDYRRGDCFPRMWDQYGENHKGVCFVVNGKKFYEIIKRYLGGSSKIFHGHMRYQDETSRKIKKEQIALHFHTRNIDRYGLTEAVRLHFIKYYRELFLRKTTDWKSEREYRFLIHNKTKKPNIVSIKKAIDRIIVGHDFPEVCEPKLKQLCQKLGIPVGSIRWKNKLPFIYPNAIFRV